MARKFFGLKWRPQRSYEDWLKEKIIDFAFIQWPISFILSKGWADK